MLTGKLLLLTIKTTNLVLIASLKWLKTRHELRCSGWVGTSCSTCGTCHVIFLTNMNEERTGLWLWQTEHICGNCDIDIPQQLTKSWWQPSSFGSDDLYVIFTVDIIFSDKTILITNWTVCVDFKNIYFLVILTKLLRQDFSFLLWAVSTYQSTFDDNYGRLFL